MRLYRPKSIRRLLLTGFTLVVVPLMAALVYATYAVDLLVAQGQHALFATVRATQSSQLLAEAISVASWSVIICRSVLSAASRLFRGAWG